MREMSEPAVSETAGWPSPQAARFPPGHRRVGLHDGPLRPLHQHRVPARQLPPIRSLDLEPDAIPVGFVLPANMAWRNLNESQRDIVTVALPKLEIGRPSAEL